jgi:hypothetical protein
MKFIKIFFGFFLVLSLFACATANGTSIVTGTVRPAIDPIGVKLYSEPPLEYETIGLVEASSDVFFSTSQETLDRAVEELKAQAAKIGANGVLIENFGGHTETIPIYSDGFVYHSENETRMVQGKAIYVFQE